MSGGDEAPGWPTVSAVNKSIEFMVILDGYGVRRRSRDTNRRRLVREVPAGEWTDSHGEMNRPKETWNAVRMSGTD